MPRSFTLVEVVVVLALLLIIVGLSLPYTLGRLSLAASGEVPERLESAVLLARAEAMRRGEAVSVVAEIVNGSIHLAARQPSASPSWRRELAVLPSGIGLRARVPDGEEESRVADPEASTVPRDMPPSFDDFDPGADKGGANPTGEARGEVLFAVVLPDGRTLSRRGLVLVDATGQRRVRLGRWTGAVVLERVQPESADGEEAEKPTTPASPDPGEGP